MEVCYYWWHSLNQKKEEQATAAAANAAMPLGSVCQAIWRLRRRRCTQATGNCSSTFFFPFSLADFWVITTLRRWRKGKGRGKCCWHEKALSLTQSPSLSVDLTFSQTDCTVWAQLAAPEIPSATAAIAEASSGKCLMISPLFPSLLFFELGHTQLSVDISSESKAQQNDGTVSQYCQQASLKAAFAVDCEHCECPLIAHTGKLASAAAAALWWISNLCKWEEREREREKKSKIEQCCKRKRIDGQDGKQWWRWRRRRKKSVTCLSQRSAAAAALPNR